MIRSICLLSREYPPDTAWGGIARVVEMSARGFVANGCSVHVLTLDPTGVGQRQLVDGVVVHRIAAPSGGVAASPDLDQMLWGIVAAQYYRHLDEQVGFDVVFGPDYFAESLRIMPGPHTALVLQLHLTRALIHPEHRDARRFPAEAAAAEMELLALGRADALIAASPLVAAQTGELVDKPITTLPLPFDSSQCVRIGEVDTSHELPLVYVGRLEPRKGIDLAIATVAELTARGVDAHLTIVGRDTAIDDTELSYRRNVLLPLIDQLGLTAGSIRFVDQLDFNGVLAHLSAARAALLPSHLESFHAAAAEALACGIPVIGGTNVGLSDWISETDGLFVHPTDDRAAFARAAADKLADAEWLATSAKTGAIAVRESFEPETATRRYLEVFESLIAVPRLPAALRSPARLTPRLSVIVLAHNALAYTRRCIESLLQHTTVPLRLIVVNNASTDTTNEWLDSLDDPRVEAVHLATNHGVSGGRNVGLDQLDGDEDYVVFLDNDTEVLSRWWEPFVAAIEADASIGIAGEDGVFVRWDENGRVLVPFAGEGVQRCDIVVGFCMVMRPAQLAQIGRFDERLGLFWHDDDDLAMRAKRIGVGIVRVSSKRVLHFEHRSSITVEGIWNASGEPAAMSTDNQRYLAQKQGRAALNPSTPFLLLADANEALENDKLFNAYRHAFTAADQSALVLLGVGIDPADYELRLRTAALQYGFDLENGPRVLALCPPSATDDELGAIGDEAYAILSAKRPTGPFAHLAWLTPDEPSSLRLLASRAWRARPSAPATVIGSVS